MIKVENYNKKHDKILFENVNLEFKKNGVYYILGDNGVGKSTFLKSLVGLETFKGNIKNLCKDKYFVFDDTPFYNNLSGLDNVKILTSVYDMSKIKNIATTYMTENLLRKKVGKYSLGQRKILNLIVLELLKPDIIIFDEFKQSLDEENTHKFFSFLEKFKNETMIFITGHDEDLFLKSDYLYKVENKQIVRIELMEERK